MYIPTAYLFSTYPSYTTCRYISVDFNKDFRSTFTKNNAPSLLVALRLQKCRARMIVNCQKGRDS